MDITDYSNIKLIVFSVDGVFTDGRMGCAFSGLVGFKMFFRKDFIALSKLREFFNIIIISDEDRVNREVFEQRNFKFYCSKNKKRVLNQVLKERNIMPDECIYVGSEISDLPCIRYISYSFCPEDAFEEIKEIANVLPVKGGYGVVYNLYKILNNEMAIRYKFYR